MFKKARVDIGVLLVTQLMGSFVHANEIKVLALQSPQIVLNELAPEFERRTGYKITQISRTNEMPFHIKQRIDGGEAFDVAFLVPAMLDQLAKEGRIIPNTRTNFLRVPIGVAVRAGAPKPDISSVEAFKKALVKAKSIAYLKAGISGPHLQSLFERFGIAELLQSKSKRPEMDTVGELVAQGEAEIGITAISTLMATRGVDIVGVIPQEIQAYVSFAGAVSTTASKQSIAQELLKFIAEPSSIVVVRLKGMEPW
jgi:molybdate transport system substrate-binding protein